MIRVHVGVVQSTFRDPGGPSGRWLYRRGLRIESRAKILCPVDTGRLRSSITTTQPRMVGRRLTVTVGTNVNYARYVHDGTRAHVVRAVRRKALRFTVAGRVVFSRYARIPARRGRPYLKQALDEVA